VIANSNFVTLLLRNFKEVAFMAQNQGNKQNDQSNRSGGSQQRDSQGQFKEGNQQGNQQGRGSSQQRDSEGQFKEGNQMGKSQGAGQGSGSGRGGSGSSSSGGRS
jgi:hypothetical protein